MKLRLPKNASSSRPTPPATRFLRFLLISLVALAVTFSALLAFAYRTPSIAPKLSLARVYELGLEGRVRSARLLDEDAVVVGRLCLGRPGQAASGAGTKRVPCQPPLESFQASYPRSDVATQQLIDRMASGGAEVEIDKQTTTAIVKLLLTFLFPLLLLANLFGIIFVGRGSESTMSEIAGFGRIGRRGKGGKGSQPPTAVTFADVGGAQEAVEELREVTDYLRDPKKFEAYGASAPKGVLLFGPPGCGKTLLARAVAGEAGVPFFPVSGAEFVESLVGVGAARVRDLFQQVKAVAPAIVFIDEIDAVGRRRSGEGSTGGEREQTVNQLLVELDGFEVNQGIVLMGATNRPDIIDPALLRPGRFDRHVTLEAPDLAGRRTILRLHAKDKPLAPGVDFDHLARRTPGFTGADLANVVNEGALLAIRESPGTQIGMAHLSESIQRVLHGPQRRGKLMSTEERRRLAYHEAGHAVAAAGLRLGASVHRVSILARGRGLGASVVADEADRVLLTQHEMADRITLAMAGLAAERLVLGDASTTGEDDLARANALARQMVGIHGMSPEVGPLRVLATDGGYLGSDARLVEAVSGQTLGAFDAAVRSLVEQGQSQATRLLTSQRDHLDRIAGVLVEQESLEGAELEALLARVDASATRDGNTGNGGATGSRPSRRVTRPPASGRS